MKITCFIKERKIYLLFNLLIFIVINIYSFCINSFSGNINDLLYLDFIVMILMVISVLLDYLKWIKNLKRIQQYSDCKEILIDKTENCNASDKAYQEIIAREEGKYKKVIGEYEDKLKEVEEYITKWVHEIKIPLSALKIILSRIDEIEDQEKAKNELEKMIFLINSVMYGSRTTSAKEDIFIKNENLKSIVNKKPGTLISMAGDSGEYLINDKSYTVSKRLNTPILGVGMDFNFLIISDENYKLLNDAGEKLYFFGIKLAADEEVDKTVALLAENFGSDKSAIYNCNMEIASVTWLKFVYAIGSFLFLVFAMATASIIYMKIYSDGFEDKERYEVLKKIGAERKDVVRAIQKEISLLYILPLALASLDSFFAINALGKFLEIDLLNVYSTSLIVCMAIFALLCVSSISSFKKIVKA